MNTSFKLKMHANLNIAKGLAADFSIGLLDQQVLSVEQSHTSFTSP